MKPCPTCLMILLSIVIAKTTTAQLASPCVENSPERIARSSRDSHRDTLG
jgi:hypothetical protein